MTAPKAPEVRAPATALDALLFHMRTVKLPEALTDKLNNKYHFSKGKLYFTHPTGDNDSLETTEPWTTTDWLKAIGMTLGAIALVAAVIVTGGAALGLAAPTIAMIGTVGVTAGVIGAGFNIAGTVADMREKERFGLLTPKRRHAGTSASPRRRRGLPMAWLTGRGGMMRPRLQTGKPVGADPRTGHP